MNYPLKNHRDFEKKTFVFFAEGPEVAEKVETAVPEKEKTPTKPEEWGEHFKENYSSEKWQSKVEEMFTKELKPPKDTPRDIIDGIINKSMVRYEGKYAKLLTRIYRTDETPEEVIKETINVQKEERGRLKRAVENLHQLYKTEKLLEAEKVSIRTEKTTWVHKIPIVGKFLEADIPILSYPTYSEEYLKYVEFKDETIKRFNEFADALGNKYFDLEDQKDRLSEEDYDRYEKLAGKKWHTTGFQDNMEDYVAVQLAALFESEEAEDPVKLKAGLESLRDNLSKRYEKYANKDGFISLAELERVERESKRTVDLTRLINESKSDEEIYESMEFKEVMNRDNWVKATELLTLQFFKDTVNNGSEAALIAKMREMTGKKIEDFNDAADAMEDLMTKKAETGVKETIEAVRAINEAVNGERTEILKLDHVKPASIHNMVRQERDLLMAGLTVPERESDEAAVVDFMRADRERRVTILKNPDQKHALFLAIQNIKKHHEKKYKEYEKSLSKKVSELTNSKNPDRPEKGDNIAARLMAVITLGKEAEWIIGQMDRSEAFKDKNLKDDLENVPPEEVSNTNMKFRDVNKLYSTRYVSRLSRGGFNGYDLSLNVGKVLAGFTLFANLMQARKQKKLGAFFTNPVIYASAAAVWGISKLQENSEVKNWFREDEAGKERISTHLSLNSLRRNLSRRRLKGFINNADEWGAMGKIMENPKRGTKQVERVLDKARKNKSEKPVLTKADLRELIGDDSIWTKLPDTGNERTRFLFYEKFLNTPRNMRELQKNCKKWI